MSFFDWTSLHVGFLWGRGSLTNWCNLKRFRGTKYHNLTIGRIITRLGTVDQSSCRCVYMDAGDGRRPFAQVLRNSLSGHPPSTGCETGIPYQMTYTARDVRASTSTGVSAFCHPPGCLKFLRRSIWTHQCREALKTPATEGARGWPYTSISTAPFWFVTEIR